jgi:hypothetical protein
MRTYVFIYGATAPGGPGPPHWRGFTITLRHITLGRTLPDGRSARHRDLYLTTSNTFKRQTSMLPAGFKPTIPENEWPKTKALDTAATGIGRIVISLCLLHRSKCVHLSLHYLSSKLLSHISGCAIGCVAESFGQQQPIL